MTADVNRLMVARQSGPGFYGSISTLRADNLQHFAIIDRDVVPQVVAERYMVSTIKPEFATCERPEQDLF